MSDIPIPSTLWSRLAGTAHRHHPDCIHNLTPDEQIALRKYTREEWGALGFLEPRQITPDQWEADGPWTTIAAALAERREGDSAKPMNADAVAAAVASRRTWNHAFECTCSDCRLVERREGER